MKRFATLLFALLLGAGASTGFADVPKTIASGHGHAIMATGKVTLLRVQEPGLKIGKDNDILDAEVLVTLDTKPGQVFGIKLKAGDESGREMVETLRAAYLNGTKVTIEHQFAGRNSNLKINWVQLGDMPAWAEAQ